MKHTSEFLKLVEDAKQRIGEITPEEVVAMLLTSPSPLVGEGGVGGISPRDQASNMLNLPPLPNPPPQGGRGFILIDVREDSEWAAGYIEGAMHMGKGVIERDIENAVADKTTKLVLYCGGGYRSALAADALKTMGYSNVLSLAEGWKGWVARGFPRT